MTRRHIVIFAIVLTNLLGAGVVVPTLPLFAEGRFGATALEAGIFVALYYLAQFFAAPIMGQLADRFGRKPILVWSQLGTIISFLLFIFAAPLADVFNNLGITILGSGIIILSFARALDGVTGGNITAAQAYISDITPEEDLAEALGYIRIAFACGIIFGPALGGLLAQFGLLMPYVGAVIITSISLLATILLLNESLPAEKRASAVSRVPRPWRAWRLHLRNEIVVILLALVFVVNFMVAGLSAVFPLFAERIAFTQLPDNLVGRNVGLMMAYIGIAAVFAQGMLLRPIVRRYGEHNAIIFSIGAAWLTCLGLSWLANPYLIALALTPAGIAYAIGIPAGEALLVGTADESSRGTIMGLYNATISVSYIIGPVLAGFLFEYVSTRAPFQASTLIVAGGLALAFWLKLRTIPEKRLQEL